MIQQIPGDTNLTRFALVRGALRQGWTRIAGAPRNVVVIDTVRDLIECGVAVEYHGGAIVVKGQGYNHAVWEKNGSVLHGSTEDARRVGGEFFHVPGDARIAGAWIAAALLCKRDLTLSRVFVTRALGNAIALLANAGANIEEYPIGHRVSRIVVRPSDVRAFQVHQSIAEHGAPLLALVASAADGTSLFARNERTFQATKLLQSLGAEVREIGSSAFAIPGGQRLRGALVRCGGDIDLELMAAIASLVAEGDIQLDDAQALLVAYPELLAELRAWGGGNS
jgi:5-enolpyruvylshikimate-3-phosphate synthase